MDPVSNLSQLVETLRRQMSSRLDRPAAAAKGAKSNQAAPQQRSRVAASELQASLAQRIKAINPDDKRRAHKATRIFLETVLANEFGDAFLSDPQFSELIEEIQTAMEADQQVREKLTALIGQLSR